MVLQQSLYWHSGHHDTQLNGILHNDTQHNGFIYDIQHNWHSADTQHNSIECHYSGCHYAERRYAESRGADIQHEDTQYYSRKVPSVMALRVCDCCTEVNSSKCHYVDCHCINEGKSAASLCHQVPPLVPDMLSHFDFVKNHRIANNSATSINKDIFGILRILAIFWCMFD